MSSTVNPKFYRRRGMGFLLTVLAPWIYWIRPRQKTSSPWELGLFQAYQLGDFYMALPAILWMARQKKVVVWAPPPCMYALAGLEIDAVPVENRFYKRATLGNWKHTYGEMRTLRRKSWPEMLDLESDPRSAFWMRLAGCFHVTGYQKPFSFFFHQRVRIPKDRCLQSEKNWQVAEAFLRKRVLADKRKTLSHPWGELPAGSLPVVNRGSVRPPKSAKTEKGPDTPTVTRRFIALSCWTGKPEKNWDLQNFSAVLRELASRSIPAWVLVPPENPPGFQAWRKEQSRESVEFFGGSVEAVHHKLQEETRAVISLDNFFAHLAGQLELPVFWINGSSDPAYVLPAGPVRLVQREMPCRPCFHRCVNPDYRACLTGLREEEVIPQLRDWLDNLSSDVQ